MIHAAVLNCHRLSQQFTLCAISILARMCAYARVCARMFYKCDCRVSARQCAAATSVETCSAVAHDTGAYHVFLGLQRTYVLAALLGQGQTSPNAGEIAVPAPPPEQNRASTNLAGRNTS